MLGNLLPIFQSTPYFMLVLIRSAAFFNAISFYNSKYIHSRIKIFLALTSSLVIFPSLTVVRGIELFSTSMAIMVFEQILIGLAMGFFIKIVFEMLILAGNIVALQAGLGFATLVDPLRGAAVPMISQVYVMAFTLIFLMLNGHLIVINILAQSFHHYPLKPFQLDLQNFHAITDFSKIMFTGALSLSLPLIVALLIVNITFAVMTRSAPQLNIFNIGFPLTLVLGLLFITLLISSTLFHASDYLTTAYQATTHFLEQV